VAIGGLSPAKSTLGAAAGPRQAAPENGAARDGLLQVVSNLSRSHHEHEKYYSKAPLVDALALQRTSRTLIALL
jgi:hypothetical protein